MSIKTIISKNQVEDFIFIPEPESCYSIQNKFINTTYYHFEGVGLLKLKNNEIISCNSILHKNNEIKSLSEFRFFTSNKPPNNIKLKLNLRVILNGLLRITYKYFKNLIKQYNFSFEELADYWISQYELKEISCTRFFRKNIWVEIKDV